VGIVLGALLVALALAWLKFRGPDIPYQVLEEKFCNDASRFVDLPGGFHVHYQDEGHPSLPLIVLLHGFGDSYTSWDGWVRELGGQYRIIRLDFPGHGLTRAAMRSRISWTRSRRNSICRSLPWRATPWEGASRGSSRCATRIG
jgi:hypothetical protein